MITTTYYGFLKPENTDSADLRVFVGQNMDLIESAISKVEANALYTVDWIDITGKPATFTPSPHTHTWADIREVPTFDNYQGWDIIVGTTTDRIASLQSLTFTSTGETTIDYNATTNTLTFNTPPSPNYYLTSVTGSGNGTVSFERSGLPTLTWDSLHSHGWNDITGKPSTFTPTAHTHFWADITDKPTSFQPVAHTHLWIDITDKPTTFEPSAHSHSWLEITNKPTEFTPIAHTHLWADITDKPTTFAPSSHIHSISEVTNLQSELDRLSQQSSPPIASTTQAGIVRVGNGLEMSGEYMFVKIGGGLQHNTTTNEISVGGTVNNGLIIKNTDTANVILGDVATSGAVEIHGNGSSNLKLVGSNHVYIELYQTGLANARTGFIGYGSSANTHLTMQNIGDIILNAQGNNYTFTNSSTHSLIRSGDAVVKFIAGNSSGSVHIRNYGDTAYGNLYAIINNTSDRRLKFNIESMKDNCLEEVLNTPVYTFNMLGHSTHQRFLGLITDEAPNEIVTISESEEEYEAINQYAMTSFLWKSVQELTLKVLDLEKRLENK